MGKRTNRILVVDDDIQVRESVSLSLETAGYTVMAAGTCQEGLQHYERFLASLIIMDVMALEDGEDEPPLQVHHKFASIPMITLIGNISILWRNYEHPSANCSANLHIAKTFYC